VARPAIRAAGPAARGYFESLDRRLLTLAMIALGAAMGTGVLDLARQALVATHGVAASSPTPQIVSALLSETRYGDIWLVRHALWLLLAALLGLREPERDAADWLALRFGGLMLGAAGLVAGAAAGHAATAPGRSDVSIAVDAIHLLAAGVWAGALVPFALFLRWAEPDRHDGIPAITVAVAVRRFSTLGLASVVVMLVTGAYAALQQIGSIPALLGTTYGHWLSAKLAILALVLGVALLNRVHLRPRIDRAVAGPGSCEKAGEPIACLSRLVLLEATLVAAMFAAVAALSLTTPARHDTVAWPLPFRFSWELAKVPGDAWIRVVDAYPTTYVRPTVAYTATSIARGQALYREHCASCHGVGGAGDGPAAAGITPRPPDLTGRRIADHTAGDLFWWLTNGIPGSTMPGFGDRLSPESRWDVVNFVRALAAAEEARDLAPIVSPRATVVAPNLSYTTGVGAERSLRDYRGQTIVVLVFFRLPESLERLSRLGRRHFDFRVIGAEILAVPLQEAGTVYRGLGHRPVLFPLAIEGADQAVAAYTLFRRDLSTEGRRPAPRMPSHMELLIDRQGYLRARWLPPGSPDTAGGWSDPEALLREIQRLADEPSSAPTPAEHIH
jgi:putative copper export protein/mono/diheme cytochrome c family protein